MERPSTSRGYRRPATLPFAHGRLYTPQGPLALPTLAIGNIQLPIVPKESNSYFGRMIGKNLDAPEEALINSVWNLHVFEENRPKKLEACIALLHYFAQIKEEVNKPNSFCNVLTHGGNPLGVFKYFFCHITHFFRKHTLNLFFIKSIHRWSFFLLFFFSHNFKISSIFLGNFYLHSINTGI